MRTSNNGWQVKSLGEIAEIVTGGTPSTAIKEYWEGGDIPWLNSGELNQRKITSCSHYITQLGLKNSVAKLMPPDTILIALTGATTGRIGYLTFEACANQSVTGILPSANHDPKFLYYHLQTLRENILKIAWGGAQKHINQKFVKDLNILLPPLPIQKQIAEILEKADNAKQKRTEANKLTDEFLQSLFIEMFGDLVKNPKGWEVKKLGELCSVIRDGVHKTPQYVKAGIPFLTVLNISQGKLDFSNTKFISAEEHNELTKRVKPEYGDILVSKDGSIGIPCYVNTKKEFSIFVSVALLRPKHDIINSIFLTEQIRNDGFQKQIKDRVKGIAIRHLHLADFKQLNVMLPPISLQQQFAEIVNKTEALKEKQKQSEQELENLFQSLMQRAFKGELI